MDENNRNFILAIILSIGVLFAWQQFFVPKHPDTGAPPAEQQQQVEHGPPQPQPGGEAASGVAPQPGVAGAAPLTREGGLAQSPRVGLAPPRPTAPLRPPAAASARRNTARRTTRQSTG